MEIIKHELQGFWVLVMKYLYWLKNPSEPTRNKPKQTKQNQNIFSNWMGEIRFPNTYFFLRRIVPHLLTSFICERTSQLSHSVQHMWLQIVTFYCLWKMSVAVVSNFSFCFLQEPLTWLNFSETLREVLDSFSWTMAQLWTKPYIKEGFLILFKASINLDGLRSWHVCRI